MAEFEFIGVANGQAIVMHCEQGHVFRFDPKPEGWPHLALARVEAGEGSVDDPGQHVPAALDFATRSVAEALLARNDAMRPAAPKPAFLTNWRWNPSED